MKRLTHVDRHGQARMVDISEKDETRREAVARGTVTMQPVTLRMIQKGRVPKGDVLAAARIAGVMAAKRVPDLIPLCHSLLLSSAEVEFTPVEEAGRLDIESRVKVTGRTGAEMEALAAVAMAALTVYDMCKAVDKEMVIGSIRLVAKTGGKSGVYRRLGENGAEG
ncbi:cyclic pyranopterin monophosphate synthase MoaC [Candidatus Methylomirabilis limnetica]|jgi:cyclic pyranopterin phosphate synthase|uniref:Cyclic pyranopterin monophosphate synthase n=1 Tax=Candidatus Methylomirabilis limnetica TaxID=2033718 RepID=A0A2T4TZ19_9BACT|nr:cyclic pyranopterin monophosphate synthase MoaC [Candidatus Methylomirabilis limnetica]PTL36354.1 cyclic pyranopterin monophosphate synthase MoaC [Candidatus Methylomirabilis limnetica]